jgi:hypothetical protein
MSISSGEQSASDLNRTGPILGRTGCVQKVDKVVSCLLTTGPRFHNTSAPAALRTAAPQAARRP